MPNSARWVARKKPTTSLRRHRDGRRRTPEDRGDEPSPGRSTRASDSKISSPSSPVPSRPCSAPHLSSPAPAIDSAGPPSPITGDCTSSRRPWAGSASLDGTRADATTSSSHLSRARSISRRLRRVIHRDHRSPLDLPHSSDRYRSGQVNPVVRPLRPSVMMPSPRDILPLRLNSIIPPGGSRERLGGFRMAPRIAELTSSLLGFFMSSPRARLQLG